MNQLEAIAVGVVVGAALIALVAFGATHGGFDAHACHERGGAVVEGVPRLVDSSLRCVEPR